MDTHNSLSGLQDIERQYPHFAVSLDTLLKVGHIEAAARLVATLGAFWEVYEYMEEGVSWASAVLAHPESASLPLALGNDLHLIMANLLRHQAQYERAEQEYTVTLSALDTSPDIGVATALLSGLGEIAFRRGQYATATDYYRQHLTISDTAHDAVRIADAYNALGRLATVAHNNAEAWEYHHAGYALAREQRYDMGVAWSLNAMGELERVYGSTTKARDYFADSATVFKQTGNVGAEILALQNLAFVLLQQGDVAQSDALFQRVLRFRQRGPSRHSVALCLIGMAQIEVARGNVLAAAQRLAQAETLLTRIGVTLELGDARAFEDTREKIEHRLGWNAYQDLKVSWLRLPLSRLAGDVTPLDNTPPHSPTLTSRERELLMLVGQGLTDKQIAAALVIQPSTVNTHLKTIYRKLGVSTRTAAVSAAREGGFL